MRKVFIIVDVTDGADGLSEGKYLGDCKGMTEDPDEAEAMLQRARQTTPDRKIVKKTFSVTEIEVYSSGEPCDVCSIVPTTYQRAEEWESS